MSVSGDRGDPASLAGIDVLFHCGLHKTGSSAIQNAAWAHRRRLAAQGWLYPRSGLDLRHPEIGRRHLPLAFEYRIDRRRWRAKLRSLLAEIRRGALPHVLLSAEAWANPGNEEALRALIGALGVAGLPPPRAVIYLRNRYDYARALYREWSRRVGNTRPFGEFLKGRQAFLDPLNRATALRACFAGRITLLPYPPERPLQEDFFGRLGVSLPEPPGQVNPSLDAVEAEGRRILNLLKVDAAGFPGARALLAQRGLAVSPADFIEPVPAGAFAPAETDAEALAALTGWPAETVRGLLVDRGHGTDVATLSDSLAEAVQAWATEPVAG